MGSVLLLLFWCLLAFGYINTIPATTKNQRSAGIQDAKPVTFLVRNGTLNIPVCSMYFLGFINLYFDIHTRYIYIDENGYENVHLKFYIKQLDTNITESAYCAVGVQETKNTMRLECPTFNANEPVLVKKQYRLYAMDTRNNTLVWEYKHVLQPSQFWFYCYSEHNIKLKIEKRYYGQRQIAISWTSLFHDRTNFRPVYSIYKNGKLDGIFNPNECGGRNSPCKYKLKNLDQCLVYNICVVTEFKFSDIIPPPPSEISCVNSTEIFRNCTRPKGKYSENRTKTVLSEFDIVGLVLVMLLAMLLITLIFFARKKIHNACKNHLSSSARNTNNTIRNRVQPRLEVIASNNKNLGGYPYDLAPSNHYEDVRDYST